MKIKKIIGIAAIVVLCGYCGPVRDRGILWRRVSSPVSGSKEQRAAV